MLIWKNTAKLLLSKTSLLLKTLTHNMPSEASAEVKAFYNL